MLEKNFVQKKIYTPLEYNRQEILRYASCRKEDETVNELLDEIIAECEKQKIFSGGVSFICVPVNIEENRIDFSYFTVESCDLKKNLAGCSSAVIFAATVGIKFDQYLRRFQQTSITKTALLQALGAERVENVCNQFNDEVKKICKENNCKCHARFSPGYGDLPLALQKNILPLLDASRKLGISLNDSLLMSPSKSVTAIIGIEEL